VSEYHFCLVQLLVIYYNMIAAQSSIYLQYIRGSNFFTKKNVSKWHYLYIYIKRI